MKCKCGDETFRAAALDQRGTIQIKEISPSDFIVSRKWVDLHIHTQTGIVHSEGTFPSSCRHCQRQLENEGSNNAS